MPWTAREIVEYIALCCLKVCSFKTHRIKAVAVQQHIRVILTSPFFTKPSLVPAAPSHFQLHLNLSLLFEHDILLLSPLFKAIRRSKSVFQELHVCHLSLFTDLTPDRKRADRHLPQGSRAIGEAAKDRDIFSSAQDGLDIKSFFGPDPIDGGKGINDSLWAGCDTCKPSRSTQAR